MDENDWQFLILLTVVIAALVWLAYVLSAASCANQADKMGMKHSFAMMQGCMIEHTPGKWVPLKNYRVL